MNIMLCHSNYSDLSGIGILETIYLSIIILAWTNEVF